MWIEYELVRRGKILFPCGEVEWVDETIWETQAFFGSGEYGKRGLGIATLERGQLAEEVFSHTANT